MRSGFCGSGLLDAAAALDGALGASSQGGGAGVGNEGAGGGCSVAANGQADASLLLLALGALVLSLWRRRRSRCA